jgi:parallel beta-helix repeat protein
MKIYATWAVALLAIGSLRAMDIQGTISSSLTIMEDSQLVGDVTCTVTGAPCIVVGASNINLYLNGFTMTGQGNPPAGCFAGGGATNIERGVIVIGQSNVEIHGPGVIQGFRGWGILFNMTTNARVRRVTLRSNCMSGIQLATANQGVLEGLICVRNGNPEALCGGICIAGSNDNRVRGNLTSGNGYGLQSVTNFGIALEGPASGNVLEGNTIVGNDNGIYLQPAAANNVISGNRIEGNPAVALPARISGFLGYDIRNQAPAGANTFRDNVCATYSGDTSTGQIPCAVPGLAAVPQ